MALMRVGEAPIGGTLTLEGALACPCGSRTLKLSEGTWTCNECGRINSPARGVTRIAIWPLGYRQREVPFEEEDEDKVTEGLWRK